MSPSLLARLSRLISGHSGQPRRRIRLQQTLAEGLESRCLLSAAPRVDVFEPVGGPDSFVKAEAHFRLVFSEPVVGIDVTDFRVISNLPFGPTWTSLGLTGGGAEWTVSVYGLEGTGLLQVYLAEGSGVLDAEGNPLYAGVSHGSFQELHENGVIRSFRSVLSEDFDGDGQAEIVFRQPVATTMFENGLTRMDFSADGQPQFASIFEFFGSTGPLLAGDLTGDDRPELVIACGDGMEVLRLGPNGVQTSLNFSHTLFDEVSDGSLMIHWDHPGTGHFADLTGDGLPDMTVVVQRLGTYHLAIVNGIGRNFLPQQFIPDLTSPGVSSIRQVATGDLNSDGLGDLVMCVGGTDSFGQVTRESRVFLGTQDNTPIEPGQQVLQGVYPGRFGLAREFALDDMDGDGVIDWIAQQDFSGLHVFRGNGDGTFGDGIPVGPGGSDGAPLIPGEVVRSDVNLDGRVDIFAFDMTADDNLLPVRRVRLFLQTESGGFQLQSELMVPQIDYFVYSVPLQPLADGQHGLELVFSRDNGANGGVSTFLQKIVVTGDLQLSAEPLIRLDGVIQGAVYGDFDGDEVQDTAIVTSGPVSDFVPTDLNLLLRNAPGTASDPIRKTLLIAEPAGNQPTTLLAADIDNDGFPDALTVSPGVNEVSFRHSFADGLFGSRVNVSVGAGPVAATTGDFNHDGLPDVATANRDAGSVSLVLGDAEQTLVWSSDIPLLGRPVAIEAVDLNHDEYPDLIVALSTSRSVAILRGTSTGTFSEPQYVFVDQIPTTMAVADLNSDGLPDIVTGSDTDSRLFVLLAGSDGIFQSLEIATGGPLIAVATTDLTKDGKTDIITLGSTGLGYTGITLHAGNNKGQFAPGEVISGSLMGATDLAVGDINGGGDDVLVLTSSVFGSQVIYLTEDLYSDESPYFTDLLTTASSAVTLTAADFTRDGRLDIALADFHRDAIRVFRNTLNDAVSAGNVQVITNLPPALNPVGPVQFLEDTAEFRVPLTGITAGAGENQLVRVITAGTTNDALIPNPLFVPGKDASSAELVLKPTRLRSGTAKLFFYLEDAGDDGNFETFDDNSYSQMYSFNATVIATRAVVLSPIGVVTSQQPEFYWSDVPGAVSYRVWVANASTGKNPLLLETTDFPGFVPTIPLGIGKIDVWVQAVLGDGRRLPWSVQHRFDIQTPVQIDPLAARQTNPRPTITWPAVPGADAYEVFASNISTGQSGVIRQTVTTTSWTPSTDLGIAQWRFWVRAVIRGKYVARWSTAREILVVTPPAPAGPSVFSTERQPKFEWSPVAGANAWGFQLRNLTTGQIAYDVRRLTTNSFTPPAPLAPGRYRWWAFAESTTTGFRGNWSVGVDVGISDRPILLAPSGNVSQQNLTFSWLPFPNAKSYEIWITRMEPRQQVMFHLTNITSTSFQLTSPLATGAVHRFWIRAVISDTQITQWSQSLAFTLTAAQTPSDSGELTVNLQLPELLPGMNVARHRGPQLIGANVQQASMEGQPVSTPGRAAQMTAVGQIRFPSATQAGPAVSPGSAPHPALLDELILQAVADLQQSV